MVCICHIAGAAHFLLCLLNHIGGKGRMQFQCPKCKAILASDDVTEGMIVTCPECGVSIECRPHVAKVKLRKIEDRGGSGEAETGLPGAVHAKIATAIGIEKLKGFKLSELFAEVFSRSVAM